MAEAAQAQASAAISPTDIKREPSHHDGLDFSLPGDVAAKRPLDNLEATIETPDAKRLKSETNEANPPETEDNYDDEMSLLVQNALSNINDIIGQFGEEPESHDVVPTTEPGAAESAPAPETQQPPPTFVTDPTGFVRKANVNALASIAVTMLLVLAHKPFDEVAEKIQKDQHSQHACKYQQLHRSLESLRTLYSDKPLISPDDFEFDMQHAPTILHFANLAQLGAWVLKGDADSIREAESHLLSIFRDEIIGLPKRIVDLLIGLKTHRAAHALTAKEGQSLSEEELGSIFVTGMEDKMQEQNIANHIIGSDPTILESLQARMAEVKDMTSGTSLSEKYPLDGLIRVFGSHAQEQLAAATELGEKLGLQMPAKEVSVEPPPTDVDMDGMDLDDLSSFFEKTATGLVESALAGLEDEQAPPTPAQNPEVPIILEPVNGTSSKPEDPPKTNGYITDYKELEALVAESTSNYVKTTLQGLSPTPYQPTVPTSTTESMAAQANYMSHLQHHHLPQNTYYSSFPHTNSDQEQHLPVPGQNLPPNQSCSSAMLYEKARQAALSRQTAHTRREGLHSTRRPWSQEEEKALMTGLDMVKGPHWSQILTLFGPQGTISDILKDRTQVQLKDKARNLKLFFLKTNSEMPYYLNTVTGELKTRAPTQAARKEAEERARMNSEEDHSKLQGIMALTSGLQHQAQQHNRAAGGTGSAVGTGVVTPAQAAAQAAASGQHRPVGPAATAAAAASSGMRPHTLAPGQPQQTTQPGAQTPARTQSQLPPQVPRPQPQQASQQQGQAKSPGVGAQVNGNGQPSSTNAIQLPQQQQQQQQQASAPAQSQPLQASTDRTSATPTSALPTAQQTPTPGAASASPAPTQHAQPQQPPQQQPQQPQQQQQSQPQLHLPQPIQPAPTQQNTATATNTTAAPAPASTVAQGQENAAQAQSQPQPQPEPAPEAPATAPEEMLELDMDTEAALIRDLQAAVAQATSS